ncbi:hypothetical protein O181_030472 [Austropuccinia psidii MF-1]|uniref:Vacuolar-sorting protein SNF8 n=1 Tax=Austropuccinia psidii MF-1 TaxID=1389203 RepID=A0A9Q3CYQ4_9BASI|nr:hypothetical protein [Austropuccinia psidii MF-1]
MRRGVGISALERSSATNASYSSLSDSLSAANLANLQSQLFTFQSSLKSFASKHGNKIKSDPEFRGAFSAMCSELGVDPLTSGRRGLWDWIGFGDWTYELAVQVIDVCLATRDRNGGLHQMEDVLQAVRSLREMPEDSQQQLLAKQKKKGVISKTATITEADISRAIKSLEPLGSGYSIINLGSKKFVRSVPAELDNDSLIIFNSILSDSIPRGYTTHDILKDSQGWNDDRVKNAIDKAVMRDSMLWLDDRNDDDGARYYAPALFIFDVDFGLAKE